MLDYQFLIANIKQFNSIHQYKKTTSNANYELFSYKFNLNDDYKTRTQSNTIMYNQHSVPVRFWNSKIIIYSLWLNWNWNYGMRCSNKIVTQSPYFWCRGEPHNSLLHRNLCCTASELRERTRFRTSLWRWIEPHKYTFFKQWQK